MSVVRLNDHDRTPPVRSMADLNRRAIEQIREADERALRESSRQTRSAHAGQADTADLIDHMRRMTDLVESRLGHQIVNLGDKFRKTHMRLIHLESVERALRLELASLKARVR
jgi:hypothetical protein